MPLVRFYTAQFLTTFLMSIFALTAKTYPAMDKDNEDKQLFWHRRLLYNHGCFYTLVGKPYFIIR